MLHLLHDPVCAAAEHADGLKVVGLDVEPLLVDGDGGARVQVPRDGGNGIPAMAPKTMSMVMS